MSDTLTCAGVGLQSVPRATHTPVAPRYVLTAAVGAEAGALTALIHV